VVSNPTQGMDVCGVYAFILCLCCPVFRHCDELVMKPKLNASKWEQEEIINTCYGKIK
jgi:hypothetical protein